MKLDKSRSFVIVIERLVGICLDGLFIVVQSFEEVFLFELVIAFIFQIFSWVLDVHLFRLLFLLFRRGRRLRILLLFRRNVVVLRRNVAVLRCLFFLGGAWVCGRKLAGILLLHFFDISRASFLLESLKNLHDPGVAHMLGCLRGVAHDGSKYRDEGGILEIPSKFRVVHYGAQNVHHVAIVSRPLLPLLLGVLDVLEQFSVVGVVLETFSVDADGLIVAIEIKEGGSLALVSSGPAGVESGSMKWILDAGLCVLEGFFQLRVVEVGA